MVPSPSVNPGDSSGQEVSKPAVNQGLTTTSSGTPLSPEYPAKRTGDDSSRTQDVPCSDKLDDKLRNEPFSEAVEADPELRAVVDEWASLSPAVRSAILTLVKASIQG